MVTDLAAAPDLQYLSANVYPAAGSAYRPAPLLPATTITHDRFGVKIGFIGETTKGTPQLVTSSGVQGLTFLDEASTANAYVVACSDRASTPLFLLIHEGGRQSSRRTVSSIRMAARISAARLMTS